MATRDFRLAPKIRNVLKGLLELVLFLVVCGEVLFFLGIWAPR